MSEELSILLDVPQNQEPWTLLNMRSIFTSGKRKGKVTKSSKKGTAWSDIWNQEMQRCDGPGKWFGEEIDEWTAEHEENQDGGLESQEDGEGDELAGQGEIRGRRGKRKADKNDLSAVDCSPVSVIYGHAGMSGRIYRVCADWILAGRGLDIKPFSKGLDTGCVVGLFPVDCVMPLM